MGEFKEYPKHLYNGKKDAAGHPISTIVKDEDEAKAAAKKGFKNAKPPAPDWAEEQPAAEAEKA